MKKKIRVLWRSRVFAAVALLATPALNGAHAETQPDVGPKAEIPSKSPLPSTTPPEIIKPVAPDALKSADAVFNKLDPGQRGYVTRRDTKDLIGFGEAFQGVDTENSGKLTRAQFRQAWSIYKSGKR